MGFFDEMLNFFPFRNKDFHDAIKNSYDGIEVTIIEDIFMPEVIRLLKKNIDKEKLISIFDFFEEVIKKADKYFLNVFKITVLEILGNDSDILTNAKEYMGPYTTELQIIADIELGRYMI